MNREDRMIGEMVFSQYVMRLIENILRVEVRIDSLCKRVDELEEVTTRPGPDLASHSVTEPEEPSFCNSCPDSEKCPEYKQNYNCAFDKPKPDPEPIKDVPDPKIVSKFMIIKRIHEIAQAVGEANRDLGNVVARTKWAKDRLYVESRRRAGIVSGKAKELTNEQRCRWYNEITDKLMVEVMNYTSDEIPEGYLRKSQI